MKSRGLLNDSHSLVIETNIGLLPIQFRSEEGLHIRMKQGSPQFIPFRGNVERLFQAMGLAADAWDDTYPIVYGSTGTWTLLIPIKELASFKQMKPQNELFPDILVENPKASIHPFSFSAYSKAADMHARHFSSPYSGTIEDPVTGTASGVMGAYYLTYVKPEQREARLTVEQGQEMGRDGAVYVEAVRQAVNHIDIFISGTAVYVGEIDRGIFT
ncbi:putative isomerase YddE [compost metagenome]